VKPMQKTGTIKIHVQRWLSCTTTGWAGYALDVAVVRQRETPHGARHSVFRTAISEQRRKLWRVVPIDCETVNWTLEIIGTNTKSAPPSLPTNVVR